MRRSKKVNDQIKQESQETIKQAYVKLLQDQKKIGKDVQEIDDAKQKDGDLPRPDAIRLGQLPGEQGEPFRSRPTSSARSSKSSTASSTSGPTRTSSRTMNSVKDDLAKPETGKPTQAEETRIEEQLQAMIDSLAIKPQQKEFDQRNKGGQGGGGKQQGPHAQRSRAALAQGATGGGQQQHRQD